MQFLHGHLAYCTNIHPAQSWKETFRALETHALRVRELICPPGQPYAIGLRLSARAATELLDGDNLPRFRDWLQARQCYVFTINGFPYGSFHGARVKENVFRPDWTDPARIEYTKNLFRILAVLVPAGGEASVSTLPGSHKSFHAEEGLILANLRDFATWLDECSAHHGIDFHLGLEPEPLGHIENMQETLVFFEKLGDSDPLRRRIGLNYDSCHFAVEFDPPHLTPLLDFGIRLSKIHLSSALDLDPREPAAVEKIRAFDEPVYFHQVVAVDAQNHLHRFQDLPDFLEQENLADNFVRARVHFHVPLDSEPAAPLHSTRSHAAKVIQWCQEHPDACRHFEIETYTWGVLPPELHREVEDQLAAEYRWVLAQL